MAITRQWMRDDLRKSEVVSCQSIWHVPSRPSFVYLASTAAYKTNEPRSVHSNIATQWVQLCYPAQKVIHDFNALADWNAQSSHLAGLITVQLISRRRSRKNEDDAQDGRIGDFVVCQKSFLSVHGITKKRLQTIQRSLKFSGLAPTDDRRKYGNRPHKLSTGTHDEVIEHIKSFKGRSSHYSMEKTSKIYLPETLNECPFQPTPVSELRIEEKHPRMVIHRDAYNGAWYSSVIRPPLRKRPVNVDLLNGEFLYPDRAYEGFIYLKTSEKPKKVISLSGNRTRSRAQLRISRQASKALVFLNRRMRRARCETGLAPRTSYASVQKTKALADRAMPVAAYEGQEQEQEAESSDDDCDDNAPLSQFTTYKGKDGTSWRKSVPPRNVKTRACNIVTHLPGCKGQARQAKLPLETWSYLIDDNIIDYIVKYTNIYIRSIQNNFVRERDASITDQTEIKALFGQLYFAGALRSAKLNAKDLWTTDGTGIPLFPATMGINRFFFLLRCLHFDDITTREIIKSTDRLAPIRSVFDYHKKLPEKRPNHQSNSPSELVKRLITSISGTGRNVTFDNWFMSVPLAKELLSDHNLTCVGTVRLNKREIPPEFVQKRHEQFSSIFGFQDRLTVTSYVPKSGKVVLVASNMHYDDEN
ncbi:hypothetical protein ANN_10324 [Periplaneta americana]|uniref:PiggyBac transposable element-derived protein domain-containing protein n=1 Tax=Periplaneta americana TaxID=6978 RepID=A0ABQ8TRV3_PERAM|nr:hypothetical protein ANN_10324 [Periplaneta americana]